MTYHNISEVLKCLRHYQEAVEYKTRAVNKVRIVNKPNHPQRQREENHLEILRKLL